LKGRSITPYDLPKAYDRRPGARSPSCYKFEMSKTIEQWLLFEYIGLEFTPLSKPFKAREQAAKAREKYPERLRKRTATWVRLLLFRPQNEIMSSSACNLGSRAARKSARRVELLVESQPVSVVNCFAVAALACLLSVGACPDASTPLFGIDAEIPRMHDDAGGWSCPSHN
jgi:hypothetical protein